MKTKALNMYEVREEVSNRILTPVTLKSRKDARVFKRIMNKSGVVCKIFTFKNIR